MSGGEGEREKERRREIEVERERERESSWSVIGEYSLSSCNNLPLAVPFAHKWKHIPMFFKSPFRALSQLYTYTIIAFKQYRYQSLLDIHTSFDNCHTVQRTV